jgi:Lrp/AsnC family leucine-responsive transcriptional regulator
MNARADLDPTDIAIIEALQDDGRMAISALGRRIGLSQPATSERVRRLEEQGIIAGYRAVIDASRLGFSLTAIIRVRTTHANIERCLQQFAGMPQVMEVHRLTGEDCFHLRVIVPSPAQLEPLVDAIARHGAVTTSVVLRSGAPKTIGAALITSARAG